MWGGGKFIVPNKKLPGFYHRFRSENKDGIPMSDRGNAACGLELDWGPDDQIVTVENADFQADTRKLFGYSYTDDKMWALREVFKRAVTLYYYRLNGGGEKATGKWGTAKYTGIRGNDIKVAVVAAVDEVGKFDVETYLGTAKVDTQRAANVADLVDNDFVVWNKDAGALTADAGTAFTGGTNGTTSGDSHQAFLDKAERVYFHDLGCTSNDRVTMELYKAYTKRMNNEVGKVCQLVAPATDSTGKAWDPDDYNIITVQNKVLDAGKPEHALVYWVLGARAGVAVNKTLQNAIYDGELTIDTDYTQTQLINFIDAGKFVFHEAGKKVRVLDDINSFVTVTEEEQSEFKNNQSVRVFYQQVSDIGAAFNQNWQGISPNDQDGRSGFRGVIIKYLETLLDIRAIQEFDPEEVVVGEGPAKGDVTIDWPTNAVNAMHKLYGTMTVR